MCLLGTQLLLFFFFQDSVYHQSKAVAHGIDECSLHFALCFKVVIVSHRWKSTKIFFFHLYSVHALPPWQHSGTTDFLTWQAIFEKSITSCSEDQCYFNIIYLDFFVHYFHESAVIVLHLFFSFFQGSSISFSMANFSFYKPTDLQVHLCVLFSADKMLFLVPENMGSNGETKQSIKQIFYLHFYTY